LHQAPNAFLCFGPDFEVVVHRRELAVEREPQSLVTLERVEYLVDDVDQRDSERLERSVPLAVPVRVRDEEDQRAKT